jgi:hypothetical protein
VGALLQRGGCHVAVFVDADLDDSFEAALPIDAARRRPARNRLGDDHRRRKADRACDGHRRRVNGPLDLRGAFSRLKRFRCNGSSTGRWRARHGLAQIAESADHRPQIGQLRRIFQSRIVQQGQDVLEFVERLRILPLERGFRIGVPALHEPWKDRLASVLEDRPDARRGLGFRRLVARVGGDEFLDGLAGLVAAIERQQAEHAVLLDLGGGCGRRLRFQLFEEDERFVVSSGEVEILGTGQPILTERIRGKTHQPRRQRERDEMVHAPGRHATFLRGS